MLNKVLSIFSNLLTHVIFVHHRVNFASRVKFITITILVNAE